MHLPAGKRLIWAAVFPISAAAGCAVLALFVVYGSISNVGTAVAAALIYMAPLMLLQAISEKRLRAWADCAPSPLDWIGYGAAKLLTGGIAALIGTFLMVLLGIVGSWRDLYLANRMVVVVSLTFALLIRLYSTTRNRLEARNRELEVRVEAESRALELSQQDYERAREIQQALMPRILPKVHGCQLAAGCVPARIVGGDYYDAIRLTDRTVAVAIGDVCGKGMAAALLMSNLQAIVRAYASTAMSPQALCTQANRLLSANVAPGKYVTFFYGVIDLTEMKINYCNAGHNPPLLQRRNGQLELLTEGGPVLGVFPDAAYIDGAAELRPDDCLLLFTDGITEAMNERLEEFGEERLKALIGTRPAPAEELQNQIMSAVVQFSTKELHDDATTLIVTVG